MPSTEMLFVREHDSGVGIMGLLREALLRITRAKCERDSRAGPSLTLGRWNDMPVTKLAGGNASRAKLPAMH